MSALLQIDDLRVAVGEKPVLNGVTLRLANASVVLL